jgi:hypothetical protein
MDWTAMPETAVNENGHAVLGEHKVWANSNMPRNDGKIPPISQAVTMKDGAEL